MPHTPHSSRRVTVLGAGAWGTTLAWLLANNGGQVSLWARDVNQAATIRRQRRNDKYLAQLELPPNVDVTAELGEAVDGSSHVFMVVPARGVIPLLKMIRRLDATPAGVVSCVKGLSIASSAGGHRLQRQTERILAELPGVPVAALSGPNLAGEIAAGQPAATTIASADEDLARELQARLQQPTFRVYTSSDVPGVELAGALKNVIAIAAGICDGLALGDNAKSTIITRGLAELVRLGTYLGGQERTFYGLAGIGDIVATCVSDRSRNHAAGVLLARG